MTVTRAEQVQSRGNEGKRALSVPRPWATGASALRPMSGQRINCLGDWIGRGGKDRNRAQETAWEALLSALRRPQGRHRARQSPPASLPLARGRENPWGSGRTGAWSQRRLPEISRSLISWIQPSCPRPDPLSTPGARASRPLFCKMRARTRALPSRAGMAGLKMC